MVNTTFEMDKEYERRYYNEEISEPLLPIQRYFIWAVFILGIIFIIVLFSGVGSAIGNTLTPTQDMIFYLRFNNDSSVGENYNQSSGFTIVDYVGHFNGTAQQGVGDNFYPNGSYLNDGTFLYDRTNDFVQLNNATPFNFSQPFTLMFWAKANQQSIAQVAVAKYFRTFEIGFDSDNNAFFRVWHSNSFNNKTEASYPMNNISNWVHYTGVWNGTDSILYINGIERNKTSSFYPNYIYDPENPILIGKRTGSDNFFNGSIDEVIIFNRSLSSNDILENFLVYVGKCETTPSENCYISQGQVIIFNKATYNFYDETEDGAIFINGSNSNIDCNGATFKGISYNKTSSTKGNSAFKLGYYVTNNVTLKNCIIKDYFNGYDRIQPFISRKTDMKTINNTFNNITYFGLNADSWTDSLIENNSFNYEPNQYTPIRLHSLNTSIIRGNIVNASSCTFAGIFNDGRENIIENNTIYTYSNNCRAFLNEQDGNFDNRDNIFRNNYVQGNGSGHGYQSDEFNFNNEIWNNTFYDLFRGIQTLYNNTLVSGNNFTLNNRALVLSSGDRNNSIIGNSFNNFTEAIRLNGDIQNYFYNNDFKNGVNTVFLGSGSGNTILSNNSMVNVGTNLKAFTTSYSYSINELHSALLHNTSSICSGSSSDINSNDNNINITLNPNQFCYVLDNFNLTEGVSRENSPLEFYNPTSFVRHIDNQLDSTLNSTVVLASITSEPSNVTYTSHAGNYVHFFNSSNWTYNSTTDTLRFDLVGIEPRGALLSENSTVPTLDTFNITFLNPYSGQTIYALSFNDNTSSNTAQESLQINTNQNTKNVTIDNGTFVELSPPANSNSFQARVFNQTWMNFDGDADYIDVTNINDFNLNENFTYMAWINVSINGSDTQRIISKRNSGVSAQGGFDLTFSVGRLAGCGLSNLSNSNLNTAVNSNSPLTLRTWYHVVCVVEKVGGTTNLSIYLNSVLNASSTSTFTGDIYNSTYNLRLGAPPNTPTFGEYNGSVDEVRIYNRTLTNSEISEIYNSGRSPNYSLNSSDLLLWLSFDENQDSTTYDKSSRRNNGTITGASYQNNGISITITSSNYSLSGKEFQLTNNLYKWSQIRLNWTTSQSINGTVGTLVSPNALDITSWASNNYFARIIKQFFGTQYLPEPFQRNFSVYFYVDNSPGELISIPLNITDKVNALGSSVSVNSESFILTASSIYGGNFSYNITQENVPFKIDE